MERPSIARSHNGLNALNNLLGFGGKPIGDVILAAIDFDGNENIQSAYQISMNSAFGISILDTRDLHDLLLQNSERDVASLIRTEIFSTGSFLYWSKAREKLRVGTLERVSIYNLAAIIQQRLNILDDRAENAGQKRKVVVIQHERNQIRTMKSLKPLQSTSKLRSFYGVLSVAQIAADVFGYPRGQPASLSKLSTELGLPFDRNDFRTAGNDANCILRVLLSLAARHQESLHCDEPQPSLTALLQQVAQAPLPPKKSRSNLQMLLDLEPEEDLDKFLVDTSHFVYCESKKEYRQRKRGQQIGGPIQKEEAPFEKDAEQVMENLMQDEASDEEEWTSAPGFDNYSTQ